MSSTTTFSGRTRRAHERAHGQRGSTRREAKSIASLRGYAAQTAQRQRATLSARWSVDTDGRLSCTWS